MQFRSLLRHRGASLLTANDIGLITRASIWKERKEETPKGLLLDQDQGQGVNPLTADVFSSNS